MGSGSYEGHEGDEEEGSHEACHESCGSSYEGHEGDEEEGRHEASCHEGSSTSGSNEGHEGHEEEGRHEASCHEGSRTQGHEGHEGHEVSMSCDLSAGVHISERYCHDFTGCVEHHR